MSGYDSIEKAINTGKLAISRPGYLKAYNKWLRSQPSVVNACATPDQFVPGSRLYIDNLKFVSHKVFLERGKLGGKTTKQIIAEESLSPSLSVSAVNKHIKKGLAGLSPGKRGKKRALDDSAECAIAQYLAEASADLEPLSHREARGSIQSAIEGTIFQDNFKKGVVSKGFMQKFLKRRHVSTEGGQLWSEFPQNMTPLRAEWTTYANLDDYFNMCRDVYLNTPNSIAVKNPAWEAASPEARETGSIEEILILRPDCLGSLDEMPFSLNMNTGQKSKSDKKISGILAGQIVFGENKEENTGSMLRGVMRGRQRTTKFNKLGTVVAGCKANGEPYVPLLIVKASHMHGEYSYSWVEGKDGEPLKIEIPKLRTGGQARDALVAVTANGGMNRELFQSYLEKGIFPCHPLLSKTDPVCFHWDGDDSHRLPGETLRHYKDNGVIIIPHKPNTTTDMQGQDLVNFPVVQQAIRSAIAERQRLIRRLPQHLRRPLDYRDMVSVLTPAIQKGFSRSNCYASFAEAGLSPFTRLPLKSSHILQTKGHSVKKQTLNYEAIQYGVAVTKSLQELLGKGVRLTTGKICNKPLTHEDNVKQFEALDEERALKAKGKAAKARMRAKKSEPGDEDIILKLDELEKQEFEIEYRMAKKREMEGVDTKQDIKLLRSKKGRKQMLAENTRPMLPPPPPRTHATSSAAKPKKAKCKKVIVDADAASSDDDDGTDLLGIQWIDPELGECTVVKAVKCKGWNALQYEYLNNDGETEKETSGVSDVRAWVVEYPVK